MVLTCIALTFVNTYAGEKVDDDVGISYVQDSYDVAEDAATVSEYTTTISESTTILSLTAGYVDYSIDVMINPVLTSYDGNILTTEETLINDYEVTTSMTPTLFDTRGGYNLLCFC